MKRYFLLKHRLLSVLLISVLLVSITPAKNVSASTYYVTNTLSSGAGSLRQNILDANTHTGQDRIEFKIPLSDPGYNATLKVWFISLSTVLPVLEDPDGLIISGPEWVATVPALPAVIILHTPVIPITADILTLDSGNNTIENLGLIYSNGDGIEIRSDKNAIVHNQIIGCHNNGIHLVSGADNNDIDSNMINGNLLQGVLLDDAKNNVIDHNSVGVEPDYWASGGNRTNGIAILGGSVNTIAENLIGNNTDSGIYVFTSPGNTISSNTIGISADGLVDKGNGKYGIHIYNSYNTYISENWIGGNGMDGVRLDNWSYSNQLERNRIGFSNYAAIPNDQHGVGIYDNSYNNYIGRSDAPGSWNVINFNGWSGIAIVDSGYGGNTIAYNYISVNDYHGVHIVNSPQNYLASNTILNNGQSGVGDGARIENNSSLPDVADRNLLWGNGIFHNFGQGINLIGDANAEIAAPTITSASCGMVTGTSACHSGITGECSVQIFSDAADEGKTYEGFTTTNSSGNFTWLGNLSGPKITAVVSDGPGNTSEFSLPVMGCFRQHLPLILK